MNIPVEEKQESKEKKKSKIRKPNLTKKNILIIAGSLLIIAGAAGTAYFYNEYQDVKNNPSEAQQVKNSEETERILAKLKAVIKVDETNSPTVARIEDPDKLKKANQEFYRDIQKGDYLIIFPDRAIVYRESNNQVINVAPIINNPEQKSKEQPSTEATQTP